MLFREFRNTAETKYEFRKEEMHKIYSTATQNGQIAKEEIYLSKPLSKV